MRFHDADDESVSQYVTGKLADAESVAFEQHLLTCIECREKIRIATAVRRGLARPRASRQPIMIAAGVAIAATLVLTLTRLPDRSTSRFGGVASAPAYEGIAVRATTGAGDDAFTVAMEKYQRGAYAESVNGFRAARTAGADSVITTFFLGASLLLADQEREAADELGRAGRMGLNAYTAESHFYRAKALLRMGDVKAALAALATASAIDGPMQGHARALADSVEAAR